MSDYHCSVCGGKTDNPIRQDFVFPAVIESYLFCSMECLDEYRADYMKYQQKLRQLYQGVRDE